MQIHTDILPDCVTWQRNSSVDRKHFQNPSTVFIPTSVLLQDATFARAASRDRQGRPFTRDIINITHAHRSYCAWERGAKMDPPK